MCMHYTTLLFSAPIRLFLRTSRDSRIPQIALHDANASVPISQMVYLSQWRMDQPNVDNRRTILIHQGSGIFRKIPRLRNKTGTKQKQEQEQKSTITYLSARRCVHKIMQQRLFICIHYIASKHHRLICFPQNIIWCATSSLN